VRSKDQDQRCRKYAVKDSIKTKSLFTVTFKNDCYPHSKPIRQSGPGNTQLQSRFRSRWYLPFSQHSQKC